MSCTITADDFKDYFDRGQFDYGDTVPEIRDKDIDQAIAEMEAVIRQDLYPTEATCKQAKLYLTAHFLQTDTDASEEQGAPQFIQSSHSADGISQTWIVPQWMQEGDFAIYSSTYWGMKWLALTKPYLDGAVFCVGGATTL